MRPSSQADGQPGTEVRQHEVVADLGRRALEGAAPTVLFERASEGLSDALDVDGAAVLQLRSRAIDAGDASREVGPIVPRSVVGWPSAAADESPDPSTIDDSNADPSTADDSDADPSTTDDPDADPSTTDDPDADPSTTDDSNADPSTADDSNADPSTTDDPDADPSTTDDPDADRSAAEHAGERDRADDSVRAVPRGVERVAGATGLGDALAADDPVVVGDVSLEDLAIGDDGGADGEPSAGTAVVAPIRAGDEPWGALCAVDATDREVTEADLAFARDVADVLGTAIEQRERTTASERRDRRSDADPADRTAGAADRTDGAAERTDGQGSGDRRADGSGQVATQTVSTDRLRELERFETLFEESSDVNAVIAPDGTFEYLPPSIEHVLGYEPEELEGQDAFERVHPEDREESWREFATLVEDPEYEPTLEFRYRDASGEWVWLEARGQNLLDDELVGGVVAYTRDVTERRRAQVQLAEERDMFAEGPAVVFRWRNEAGWPVEYVSDNVEDQFGYAPEALESGEVPYVDLLLEEELDRIAREVEAHSDETTERFSHEPYRVQTADGELRWVEDTTKILRDEDGEITHYLGYLVDVTERKERERELERYETIVENLPVGVYRNTPGPEGEFVAMNSTLPEIFDVDSVEAMMDVSVSELYTDSEERAEFSRQLEEEGVVRGVELEQETLDGRTIWISVTGMKTEEDGEVYFDGIVQDVTEQKARERELERYEAVVETVDDGVYVVDEDGTFRMVNEAYAELVGRDREALLGAHVSDVVDEATRERARELEAAMEAGEIEQPTIETDIETADGEVVPMEARFALLDGEGDGWHRVAVVRDVSERKARERELERFETIVEAIDDGIYVKDDEGYFTTVNDAYAELTGYDREELVGSHASLVVDEETIEASRTAQAEADEASRTPAMEASIQRADGGTVPAEATFATLGSDDAREEIGVVRDVSERKERQRKLRERERQLSTLMDNVPGMVYRCRNESGWPMEFVSDAARDLTGHEPAAFERGEVSLGEDVIVEEDRTRVWEEVQAGIDDGGDFLLNYRIETADGEVRWVRERGRGIFDEDGELDCLEGVIIDVTQRKRLESELEEVYGRVSDAFFALDEDWEFTHLNERAHELINPDDRELLGQTVWETFPEAAGRKFEEKYERAMYEQETVSFEEYYPEPLDTWFEVQAYPSETGMSVYFRDVTDRKHREQELERKERRYQAVFEDPNILVGLLEPDGTVLDINETAMEYVDADLADVRGEDFWETPWWGAVDDGDAADGADAASGVREDVREWTERAADGEYVEFQADLERPDGQEYVLEGYFRPVTNEDGEVVSIIVSDRDVTERKARERELEESEQRYRSLVEHFPNGAVALVDEELRYQTVGGSPTDVVDAPATEVEGRPVAEAVPPELAEELVPAYEAALEVGESTTFETDLGERIFQFQVAPVRDDDGDVFAALGMSQDVTEQRENERRLEESEQRYRALAEHFPGGIVTLFDHDLTYELAAGQGFADISVDPDDLEGEHFSGVWDEETVAELEPALESVLEGEDRRIELSYEGRDWIVHAVPITDERGEVFAGMTMARDITERKEYERYLVDAKSQLEAATEAGTVGTWEWDVVEDEMVVGETFAETFGIDPEAAREGVSLERFLDAVHPADRECVEADLDAALEDCGEYEAEYRVYDADGDVRWVVARGEVECDEAGEPATFPGAVTDITERKRAELELERSKEQLESLFEILPVGVVVAEAGGRMVHANDTAHEIWGGDVFDAESTGEYDRYPVFDADTGDPVAPGEMTLSRVLDGEAVTEPDVYEIETLDDERRIVEIEGMPIRDGDGEVVRGVVTMADVTQRHEYQRRIEESERRYRTMIEQFPNGAVGLFDEDLEYVAAGGGALEDVDVDPEEIVGIHVRERYPEDVADEFEPRFRAALAGESSSFEFEFHGRHWVAHTVPVGGPEDVHAGMVMVQDITDRKEMEEDLRESEAKFRMLAENLEQIVWMSDAQTQETYYVNPAFEEVWGVSRDVLFEDSETLTQAVHPEDRDRVASIFGDSGQIEYDVEFRIVRPDGDVRWLHTRTVAIRDEDGTPDRVVGIADDVTERTERERQLEESERRYRALVEHFPDGAVGLFDEELEYTAIGGQLLEAADVEADERIGSSVSDIYPEDVMDEVEPYFEAAIDGEASDFEVEFHGRHLFAHTLPIRDADGEVFAGMIVVQDVTERRESERRLERYRDFTDHVLDAIPDVFYILDREGQMERWNESLVTVSGYDDAEIAEMGALEFFDDDQREAVEAAIAGAFETGETQLGVDLVTAEGESIPFEFVGSTVEDPDGTEVLAGMGRDVTERERRRRQLEESERRYRTLAEHFPNGAVGVYDEELRYTLAAGAKLGDALPSAEHLEGDRMPEIFPEETAADLEPVFRAAVEDGETDSTHTELGGHHWDVWTTPLRDADGEVFAGLSFAQDVTEQVEREERLADLVGKLEASNERLEQFAYAASHDLQEPLRMVSSYLQLIERRYADDLDADGQEFIDYAVDGADRMREMIDGLLEYSRVETRGDPFEVVDLSDLFDEARRDLQVRLEESDADVTVEALPTVEGDAGQLRQVFENLLRNAVEYSGDEPPSVHVSARRASEADVPVSPADDVPDPGGEGGSPGGEGGSPGGEGGSPGGGGGDAVAAAGDLGDLAGDDACVISVEDEGIGIDPEQSDRIFQVFQRLHGHDEHPGTGIGLALCRRIVERHGGRIWVDSTPGEGATFSFTLPARGDGSHRGETDE